MADELFKDSLYFNKLQFAKFFFHVEIQLLSITLGTAGHDEEKMSDMFSAGNELSLYSAVTCE